jgi:DNA-binding MarR family transcriptional regulator
MNYDPQPLQTLFLWRLLASGGGEFSKDIKPKLTTQPRKELIEAGLIAIEKQKHPRTGRRCDYVALTDAGWQWAETHLNHAVSPRSTSAGPILQGIMTLLKAYLARHQTPLAALVDPSCDTATDDAEADGAIAEPPPQVDSVPGNGQHTVAAPTLRPTNGEAGLQQRVISTCCHLANGRPAARIRLAALRAALADVPRARLDRTLLDMEQNESVVLYPLDNPQELFPDDTEAALPNSAGFNRHILYLEN